MDGGFYFVTWRLADSLPQAMLSAWHEERHDWLSRHPKPWTSSVAAEYRTRFPKRLEGWLDDGYGTCILRESACARIVGDAMHYFDGVRYELASFVVMPNHAHSLFQLRGDFQLEDVMHSWKSYTSHELNNMLGRRGSVWQQESWDHLLRGVKYLERCLDYIAANPAMAGLGSDEALVYEAPGYRALTESR